MHEQGLKPLTDWAIKKLFIDGMKKSSRGSEIVILYVAMFITYTSTMHRHCRYESRDQCTVSWSAQG